MSNSKKKNEFIISNRRKWLSTYFFKVNKCDYFRTLSPLLSKMDDSKLYNIERLWYKALKEEMLEYTTFYRMPRIHGIYGNGNGKKYDKNAIEYALLDFERIVGMTKVF